MSSPPYRTPESPQAMPTGDPVPELGPLRSTHRPPGLGGALVPALFSGILVAAVCVSMGVAMKVGATALIGLAPGVLLFAVLAIGPLSARGLGVDVHSEGVVVSRWRQRDAVAFEDVDTVWFVLSLSSSPLGDAATVIALRLVDHAGASHRVPLRLPDAERIAHPILSRCSARHLDAARAALREGETLTFGGVGLSRQGVSFGGPVVPWSEFRLVRFQPGRVAFLRSAPLIPWRTVRLDRVPHPLVFQKLVEECARRTEIDDPLMGRFG